MMIYLQDFTRIFMRFIYFLKVLIEDKKAQSLTEYSLIMAGLMGLFIVAGFDLFPRFIRAFQLYFDSYYIMLNLPIP